MKKQTMTRREYKKQKQETTEQTSDSAMQDTLWISLIAAISLVALENMR